MPNRSYTANDGTVWDSRFESEVYDRLSLLEVPMRRCEAGRDSLPYDSSIKEGFCLECESNSVVQRRLYTPDLRVGDVGGGIESGGSYIEAKGWWPAPRRRLLREALKGKPLVRMLFVFQKDNWITKGKSRYTDYVARYIKTAEALVWDDPDFNDRVLEFVNERVH